MIREAVRQLDRSGIRVARAILFGSFAQGRMRQWPWSDIDVALISRDYRPTDFRQRVRIGLICQDVDVRMETVVYRPEDFRKGEPLALEIERTGIELRL
ncbi:MAG: nucleotidyltransferase domain-containing protein [Desulfobacteria bacterium]